jgi:hypothetical protein
MPPPLPCRPPPGPSRLGPKPPRRPPPHGCITTLTTGADSTLTTAANDCGLASCQKCFMNLARVWWGLDLEMRLEKV